MPGLYCLKQSLTQQKTGKKILDFCPSQFSSFRDIATYNHITTTIKKVNVNIKMMTKIDVCEKTWTCWDNNDKVVVDLVGASARLHFSAHLSRSLTNLLWVQLRVLHGTQFQCYVVTCVLTRNFVIILYFS